MKSNFRSKRPLGFKSASARSDAVRLRVVKEQKLQRSAPTQLSLIADLNEEALLRAQLREDLTAFGIGSAQHLAAVVQLISRLRTRLSRAAIQRLLSFQVSIIRKYRPNRFPEACNSFKQLARLSEEVGALETAEICYLEAHSCLAGLDEESCEDRARILKSLSALNFRRGRSAEAVARAREANQELECVAHPKLRERIEVVAHLGSLLAAVNRGEEGILYLVSALTLTETCEPSCRALQADIADRIVEIAETLGERTRAIAYSRLSRKVRAELGSRLMR